VAIGSELAQRGLAEDHCAGGAQVPDDVGVGGRGHRLTAGAVRGDLAGNVDVVLDRDRHAQQRTPLPVLEALQRCISLLECAFGANRDERAQRRVQPLDPCQVELGQLARRYLACPEQLAQARDAGEREILVGARARAGLILICGACHRILLGHLTEATISTARLARMGRTPHRQGSGSTA
jgi:hypothetical protein